MPDEDPDLRPEDTNLVAGIEAALARRHPVDETPPDDAADATPPDDVGTEADAGGEIVPPSDDVTQDGSDGGDTSEEIDDATIEFAGLRFTEEGAANAAGLLNWFSTLDEDQARRVFAAASGELTGIRPDAPPAPTPAPEPAAPSDPFAEIREYTDPATMKILDGLNDRIEQQQAQLQMQQAQQFDENQREAEKAWQQVATEFPEKYGLTEGEFAALSNRVQSSEILTYYAPKAANAYDAFTKSFEHILFGDEEFRDKLFRSQMDRELAQRQAVETQNESKKRKAASVTSTSGSVSRANIPVDRRAMTPQERQAALAADIAAIQAGGQG